MHEHVLAGLWRDEAKALVGVEPLHGSNRHVLVPPSVISEVSINARDRSHSPLVEWHPLVGGDLASQAQLGEGGQHQPGPAVGLLGMARAWDGPAKGLFGETHGVLEVEPANVGP